MQATRVLIVGLGKSGISAAKLCLAQGARVTGSDSRPVSELSPELRELGISLLPDQSALASQDVDLVVVSPGVPPLPAFDALEARGVEVIGELELAARSIERPIVAIGGTNGKSTTTTLVAELLQGAGLSVFAGGNLGTPATVAVGGSWDAVVLEVSSFQLERAPSFRPRVSVLLNVSEDHLDRYPSFSAYADAKGNAFVNQSSDDLAVIPFDDPECERQARRGKARRVSFGVGGDYDVVGRSIVERASGERFELEGSKLFGRHNALNAAAAIAVAREFRVGADAVQRALRAFTPLAHRMALVGQIGAVRFYDDSKGTNVGASVTALLGLEEARGVLIAGGRDKLGSYEPLVAALKARGRALVVIGEASERIAEAVADSVPCVHATSMDEAVERAYGLAQPGDAVLLSPACSSFDMFKSYADRGDKFVSAFARLAEKQGQSA